MSGLPWFRLYAELAGDPVVQSLAFEDQRHYVILLCLKCSGVLDRRMSGDRREAIIAKGLGLDLSTASEVKRRLSDVTLCNGEWQPTAWNKRQYKSDNSAERVRKHRKNKKTGNVSEALQKRDCNGPDTDTDTEDSSLRSESISPPIGGVLQAAPTTSNGHDNLTAKAQEVLDCMNRGLKTRYKATTPKGKVTANGKLIADRLRDGHTVTECKQVYASKANEWWDDEKMKHYLRPITLFCASKFETYLAQIQFDVNGVTP